MKNKYDYVIDVSKKTTNALNNYSYRELKNFKVQKEIQQVLEERSIWS